ncbi:TetR/AcrR family transcriptional regulator [Chloracidobacterium aggregatum]|uniref:TetR/AcrR family transcriptional regulator n=1 Tax=Chloracidobacterium sp. N TaxID=2821540 RepID=A0ABX8B1Z3_9BACT|nr:TetR/AcrR family transcriptional regulator [Chloracidobacterium aggregatum]QUV95019.1 TetR/AcrR family transcriptional regulator [Chloracidobacterium sp. N]
MGVQERKSRHKANVRRLILDAARDLFVTEGYQHTSLRKIAEKIEYSPATIYLYFQDKSELLDALLTETFTELDAKLRHISLRETDSLTALRRGLRTYIEFGLSHPNHYLLAFVQNEALFEGERKHYKLKHGPACFDNLRQAVRRAISDGHLTDEDPETTAQALWAAAHGLTSLLITQPDFPFVARRRLIERMLTLLLDGVRRRQG